MNILYISKLRSNPWAGPTYSVPMQIKAQRHFDNVLWYNLINPLCEKDKTRLIFTDWKQKDYYKDLQDIPSQKLSGLPAPFNKPDLVIVEQFYTYFRNQLIKEIVIKKIPFIIIPRGELTQNGQRRKKIKKTLGNLLYFNKFAKGALAIQYLTNQEKLDSGIKWNTSSIVVPNGIDAKNTEVKCYCTEGKIKCVTIGRIEPYQKGLDLLIDACNLVRNIIRENCCCFEIYGPDWQGKTNELKKKIVKLGINDIVIIKDALYGAEKIKVLDESDVFIMTSRFEGHPMALIEAMDMKIPCLVTVGSNMKDEIQEFDAGWTADCTVDSIANAIKLMLNDVQIFEDKGCNAKKLASEYDWNKLAKRNHDLYYKLMGKG